jgi:hypothetical protein
MFRIFCVWMGCSSDAIFRWFKKIIEAFENENRYQNRRFSIATIYSLTRNPPLGPRRTGRRMGGWMGTNK